jgi:hypothetical protein
MSLSYASDPRLSRSAGLGRTVDRHEQTVQLYNRQLL